MENQHRQIKGYRELDEREIALMNEVKEMGAKVGELVEKLQAMNSGSGHMPPVPAADRPDQRWVSIGKTHLQEGFMELTRSIAKPGFF